MRVCPGDKFEARGFTYEVVSVSGNWVTSTRKGNWVMNTPLYQCLHMQVFERLVSPDATTLPPLPLDIRSPRIV